VGASSSLSAAQLDTAISGASSQLAAAGITYTGTAAGGNLHFTKTDGSNIAITQTLGGSATGGIAGLTSGVEQDYTSSVSLNSSGAIVVGGSSPTTAGLAAGTTQPSFAQDATQAAGTVTINSSNNSLQGIRDAINQANIGVTASIIGDGSATPNHLVLTSNKTGATSSMKIAVSGDSAVSNLLAYGNMTQTVAGQNANLTVNGIAVTSATNVVSSAIQGVTITASKIGSTSLNVSRDTASIKSAISSFVTAYNAAHSALSKLTAYDATTKQAGPLLGDPMVQSIQAQLGNLLTNSVTGTTGSLTTLASIGVSLQKDGTLTLDSTKLQSAISNNFSSLASLFAANGTTSDSLISYVSSTSSSKPGQYNVNVTALATQGTLTGNAGPGLTITTGTNDQLAVTIDGTTASVNLVAGTYTASSLAAQVQSAINGSSALSSAGSAVTVSVNASNQIVITSNRFGSASTVTVGGDGAANLLGASPTTANGTDVAGTINGVAAGGSGQFLTGALGSSADGIKLQVTGGATGARGTVNFAQGYAYQLNNLLTNFLGSSGIVASGNNAVNANIKSLQAQEASMQDHLNQVQKLYMAQFTALDTSVASMQQTQQFLTQQLASLASLR
jgi:flagellar hook-associated protein 2